MGSATMSIDAIVFSIVVFLIWSFIPFLGYVIAKMFKAKGRSSGLFLFAYGAAVGLSEKGLLKLDILSIDNQYIGYIGAIVLFTAVAYVSVQFPARKQDKLLLVR